MQHNTLTTITYTMSRKQIIKYEYLIYNNKYCVQNFKYGNNMSNTFIFNVIVKNSNNN